MHNLNANFGYAVAVDATSVRLTVLAKDRRRARAGHPGAAPIGLCRSNFGRKAPASLTPAPALLCAKSQLGALTPGWAIGIRQGLQFVTDTLPSGGSRIAAMTDTPLRPPLTAPARGPAA